MHFGFERIVGFGGINSLYDTLLAGVRWAVRFLSFGFLTLFALYFFLCCTIGNHTHGLVLLMADYVFVK